jgi:lipopolysaccharide transport system ATP-binding protein
MQPIARIRDISKAYQLGSGARGYTGTLRDAIAATVRNPLSLVRRNGHAKSTTLWALRDVSFDVERGEVIGIVGRNGAGKSTLLKILSRITQPTSGQIELYGQVSSLLEVGTGFHPELSGRENIFLNGAMLGMRKAEIQKKLDDIIAFAELEEFMDTPVKRYSSGMYVRLAFAVAAHLEPEILIVDEVLAVGDGAFQKKCLGKMNDHANRGRTVFFVSHNMAAVATLCNRGLLIEQGHLKKDGDIGEVIASYQSTVYPAVEQQRDLADIERYGSGRAKFKSVSLHLNDPQASFLYTGQDLKIAVEIVAESRIEHANVAVIIYDQTGYRLIDANTALKGRFLDLEPGQHAHVEFQLHELLLKPGTYMLGLWLGRGHVIDGITYATAFSVEADPQTIKHVETFPGIYQCRYSYTMEVAEENRLNKSSTHDND